MVVTHYSFGVTALFNILQVFSVVHFPSATVLLAEVLSYFCTFFFLNIRFFLLPDKNPLLGLKKLSLRGIFLFSSAIYLYLEGLELLILLLHDTNMLLHDTNMLLLNTNMLLLNINMLLLDINMLLLDTNKLLHDTNRLFHDKNKQ